MSLPSEVVTTPFDPPPAIPDEFYGSWKSQRPSRAGWYWLKVAGKPPQAVKVTLGRQGNPEVHMGERYTAVRDEEGVRWCGPFFPPAYEG